MPDRSAPARNPPASGRPLIILLAFALGVLSTYVAASLLQTAFVLAGLIGAGASIPFIAGLKTAAQDLYGLTFNALFIPYPLLLLAGFLVALPTAALLRRATGWPRQWLYPLAGAIMMASLLVLAKIVFYGITLYAGTRGAGGFLGQMVAGAIGGWVFATVLDRYEAKSQGRAP